MSEPNTPPPELLLGRAELGVDMPDLSEWLRNRRVLLTGAAGSVGRPLARTLLAARPASLILLDHHEHSLFSLERALGTQRPGLSYELVDIRDEPRMRRLFEQHTPEVVIHLAAAKHVPYGERFPEGAVVANVLALHNLLALADAFQTETFVYPSSDKSVEPPSVYGATKRLAEALVQVRGQASRRRWAIVRYVNIIGTRGSVIETFTEQVLADRPLSVTDERMTRYWISMREALWSLLTTARCATPGQVLMPACGEPVAILATAQRLAGWYRPQRVPYPIQCTGIRPGERLHEVLLSRNESFSVGPADGVLSIQTSRDSARLTEVPRIVDDLRRLADAGDRGQLAHACVAAADNLQ